MLRSFIRLMGRGRLNRILTTSALIALYIPIYAIAQPTSRVDDRYYNHHLNQELSALGDDAFADQTSLADGATIFRYTDVDIKLNSGLPMRIGRRLDLNSFPNNAPTGSNKQVFGEIWELDIPYMRGVFDQRLGWSRQGNPSYIPNGGIDRCSAFEGPPTVNGQIQFTSVQYAPTDYSTGIAVNLPDSGEEPLLKINLSRPKPSTGTYTASTKSEARMSCLPAIKNGSGQGFKLTTTDGTSYHFDWMVVRDYAPVMDTYCYARPQPDPMVYVGANPAASSCSYGAALPRVQVFFYATRVEDRFGNWVEFNFNPAKSHQLTSVRSNEGPEILVDYIASGLPDGLNDRVQRLKVAERQWTYEYTTSGVNKLTLPDGSDWTYTQNAPSSSGNIPSRSIWTNCQPNVGTLTQTVAPAIGGSGDFIVKHPSGAVGTFTFRRLLHGFNNSWGACDLQSVGSPGGSIVPFMSGPPWAHQVISLVQKSIAGPGISTPSTWAYRYYPTWSSYRQCNSSGCVRTSATEMTAPDGSKIRYEFGNDFQGENYGKLLNETVSHNNQQLRRTEYSYAASGSIPGLAQHYGEAVDSSAGPIPTRIRPLKKRTIIQDGRKFSNTADTFDSLARPTQVTEQSEPTP